MQGGVAPDGHADQRRLERERDERGDRQAGALTADLDGDDRDAVREAAHDRAQLVAPDHRPIIGASLVMQALVPAEVAGVLFTIDPVSGSGERWIVEASWGLGEAVVGGLITPDRYVIARTGELLERQLGHKDIAIVADEHGGTTELAINNPARVQEACLGEKALVRLAELGAACEGLLGANQDIEWALSSGTLYLLQCRPVTSGGRP